jgi:glutathione S-transferase
MRVLYHFQMSPFSRRVRLALAHKGLDADLRDGRVEPAFLDEAFRLTPIRTIPVLDDEGKVVADSMAILQYLDRAYPEAPTLWPHAPEALADALAITSAVDVATNALADMGTRYWPLRNDPAWATVLGERMSRAQAAIDFVAAQASRPVLAGWGAAEMWTLATTLWVMGMPARAKTAPLVAQMLTLGFRLPDVLVEWAKPHEGRPEVRAIYG